MRCDLYCVDISNWTNIIIVHYQSHTHTHLHIPHPLTHTHTHHTLAAPSPVSADSILHSVTFSADDLVPMLHVNFTVGFNIELRTLMPVLLV